MATGHTPHSLNGLTVTVALQLQIVIILLLLFEQVGDRRSEHVIMCGEPDDLRAGYHLPVKCFVPNNNNK